MSDLTERPEQDPEPELTQAPSGHDRESDDEEEALAICQEQQLEEELRYRYCDDPFCGCTYDKLRFLSLVGIFQDGCLTRHGQRLEYLWNTDPDTPEAARALGFDRRRGLRRKFASFCRRDVEPKGVLVLTGV